MYGPQRRGLGATCLRTNAAGQCTLVDDNASDITVNVRPDAADEYFYTDSRQAITFGNDSFTAWLNKNAMTVALGAGAFFLLVGMTKR